MKKKSKLLPLPILLLLLFGILTFQIIKPPNIKKTKIFPQLVLHLRSQEEREFLKVSIATILSPNETAIQYGELLSYLSKKIDRPIALLQRKSYRETNKLIKEGKIDLAIICTGVYPLLQNDAEVLVAPVIRGSPTYHSYFIVNRKENFQKIEDLKGKTFAFTDPLSLSGHIYPIYVLEKMGYKPETFFKKTLFSWNHDNSIRLVNKGIVNGAAVDSLVYEYLFFHTPEAVKNVKVIHSSPPFPAPPIVVSKNVKPELKERILTVLINMSKDDEGYKILRKLGVDEFRQAESFEYINEMQRYSHILNKLNEEYEKKTQASIN